MKIRIGFSPCPNDTFIFDALVNNKIDTQGIEFIPCLEDVQQLNLWALEGKLELSKISYGVLPLILPHYRMLNSGGALGRGVGPLLISKSARLADDPEINNATIALPGENTTAHLLFSLAYPNATQKHFQLFSSIEKSVLEGVTELGVIIHENRFTYKERGLELVQDLGSYWEKTTGKPIPLGGIAAKNELSPQLKTSVDQLIRKSVEYAFTYHHEQLTGYVKAHAQEMEESVMRQHIDLYVNEFSITLGKEGRAAVEKLMSVYQQLHPEIVLPGNCFID